MKALGLTPRQIEVFEFVSSAIDANGYAPSIHEICAGLGLKSTATVHKHLRRLAERGMITRTHHARAMSVVGDCPACKGTGKVA